MAGGGAERQLAYLAEALSRLRWEVHVALTRRGSNWARLEQSGAIIHEVAARTPYDWRVFGALRRIIRHVNPDLIQVWLLQMEIVGGLAALTHRKPWIFSERSSKAAYPLSLKNAFRIAVARFASAIVANSRAGDEYWRNRLGPRIRRHTIPNGVPLAEIAAAPVATVDEMGIAADGPLILFAGRLEPEKNINTLLEASKIVLSRHDAQVLCCGQGSLQSQLEAWIDGEALGDRVKMVGYTPRLWSFMKRASVLVSPSRFEGSPNVVLEAMACGVPLVVSDIPEHRELLDDSSAVLVPPASAEGLAEAVEAVLRDPGAARARARVARDRVTQYGLPMIAQHYSDVYRNVLCRKAAVR
jgi:glycosyltransferase involved in cell wall biosynthesis